MDSSPFAGFSSYSNVLSMYFSLLDLILITVYVINQTLGGQVRNMLSFVMDSIIRLARSDTFLLSVWYCFSKSIQVTVLL